MNRTSYLGKELRYGRGRSLATVLSTSVSVLAAVLPISIATTCRKAIQAPMNRGGAGIVTQLNSNIPRALEGLVFSHPHALLEADSVAKIAALPGVVSVTRAVYLRELQPTPTSPFQALMAVRQGWLAGSPSV